MSFNKLELGQEQAIMTLANCPHCHSIFIEDDACENCGHQLKLDRLGLAFGAKSLYALKAAHWQQAFWWVKLWPELESKRSYRIQVYKRKLLYRYRALIFALADNASGPQSQGHYLELGDMILELLKYGFNKNDLLKEDAEQVFPFLTEWVESLEQHYKENQAKAKELLPIDRSLLRLSYFAFSLLAIGLWLPIIWRHF